jgi:segregation and condensation protein A
MDQTEIFGKLHGEPIKSLPRDLYIPPEALKVFLEAFEGPLDLLLYLIKKQNIDILDIPIADVTRQYIEYIKMMQNMEFELVAEYLVMAATLAEIKSRLLLPKPVTSEAAEEDPRAELVRRLQEYERFKQAAEKLAQLPCVGRDIKPVNTNVPLSPIAKIVPKFTLQEICYALQEVLSRAALYSKHHVQREPLSTRERMAQVLLKLTPDQFVDFLDLFDITEGRPGVIVTFVAILELIRQSAIEIVQAEVYGKIHVKRV